ncbi:MAG: hypothetical protein WKF85_02460 [Chitinophagaceae bacterium]
MKTIKSISFAVILFIAGTTISYAQKVAHIHKAPHGGMIQEAGSYHIEMVQDENNLTFYLLDAKSKTLSNKAVKGSVLFEFLGNKTKAPASLNNSSNNALIVSIPKANTFGYCTISLKVKGKTVSAKFLNDTVSKEDIEHGHQH